MGLRSRIKNRIKKTLGVAGPAPEPAPAPAPAPVVVAPPTPKPRPVAPPKPVAAAPAPEVSEEERVKQEKAARHFERARKGVLGFVQKAGGRASLADMHNHSEMRYFIGHQKFSRLMEGLTDEGLLVYYASEGEAELTDAGRDYIA